MNTEVDSFEVEDPSPSAHPTITFPEGWDEWAETIKTVMHGTQEARFYAHEKIYQFFQNRWDVLSRDPAESDPKKRKEYLDNSYEERSQDQDVQIISIQDYLLYYVERIPYLSDIRDIAEPAMAYFFQRMLADAYVKHNHIRGALQWETVQGLCQELFATAAESKKFSAYDPYRGAFLSTFLGFTIKQDIPRALDDTIISDYQRRQTGQYGRVKDYIEKTGRYASLEQLNLYFNRASAFVLQKPKTSVTLGKASPAPVSVFSMDDEDAKEIASDSTVEQTIEERYENSYKFSEALKKVSMSPTMRTFLTSLTVEQTEKLLVEDPSAFYDAFHALCEKRGIRNIPGEKAFVHMIHSVQEDLQSQRDLQKMYGLSPKRKKRTSYEEETSTGYETSSSKILNEQIDQLYDSF